MNLLSKIAQKLEITQTWNEYGACDFIITQNGWLIGEYSKLNRLRLKIRRGLNQKTEATNFTGTIDQTSISILESLESNNLIFAAPNFPRNRRGLIDFSEIRVDRREKKHQANFFPNQKKGSDEFLSKKRSNRGLFAKVQANDEFLKMREDKTSKGARQTGLHDVISNYYQLRTPQHHHIIEDSTVRYLLGISKNSSKAIDLKKKGISVMVDEELHQEYFTKRLAGWMYAKSFVRSNIGVGSDSHAKFAEVFSEHFRKSDIYVKEYLETMYGESKSKNLRSNQHLPLNDLFIAGEVIFNELLIGNWP